MSIFSVGSSTPSEGFELKSVRFNDNDSSSLRRTPTVAGNRRTWTTSFWVKRSEVVTSSNPGDEMLFKAPWPADLATLVDVLRTENKAY